MSPCASLRTTTIQIVIESSGKCDPEEKRTPPIAPSFDNACRIERQRLMFPTTALHSGGIVPSITSAEREDTRKLTNQLAETCPCTPPQSPRRLYRPLSIVLLRSYLWPSCIASHTQRPAQSVREPCSPGGNPPQTSRRRGTAYERGGVPRDPSQDQTQTRTDRPSR